MVVPSGPRQAHSPGMQDVHTPDSYAFVAQWRQLLVDRQSQKRMAPTMQSWTAAAAGRGGQRSHTSGPTYEANS